MLTTEQRLRMLETPKAPVDLVIDTDAYNEIDDQFAIAYALCAPERVRLLALCAAPFTNARSTGPADGMEKSYQEILHLLSLTGDKVPAYRGSTRYLPDEQTPVSSQAAEELVRLAMEHTPEAPLYVAAIGAITNVASALLMEPGIADRMVVVWLGGHALDWPDNREFNAQQDVAADRVVFGSGVPLVILPCQGVVSAFTTTGPELDYWLRGKNSLCDYLVKQTVERSKHLRQGQGVEPGDLGCDHRSLDHELGREIYGRQADSHAHSAVRSSLQHGFPAAFLPLCLFHSPGPAVCRSLSRLAKA